MLHYLDYRETYDVDAWWQVTTTTEERRQVTAMLENTLAAFGEVRIRTFGDVTSVELATEQRKKAFSFQIAVRSAQIASSVSAQWLDVPLDALPESNCQQDDGACTTCAPRDFRDIHAICESTLADVSDCWQRWQQRQALTNDDADVGRAKLAIAGHLERIEQYRPLSNIHDPVQQSAAAAVRQWYKQEFLNARLG